jgi:hypothetical protein
VSTGDSWCTPPTIGDPLVELFGGPVDVDPCSNTRSIIQARLAYRRGGLVLPWRLKTPVDRTVYENDPYSKSALWTDKMLRELDLENVAEIVRLSIMATSTEWWEAMCSKPKQNPRILGIKRVAFLDPRPERRGMRPEVCRFEPALTYIGHRPEAFTRTFAHLTRWAAWGR